MRPSSQVPPRPHTALAGRRAATRESTESRYRERVDGRAFWSAVGGQSFRDPEADLYGCSCVQLYWTKMNQGAHVVTSALQRAVHASLERLGVPCMEEFADAQYVIDIALPAQRIAVEVDGPHHYAANARDTPLGPTRLKHRLLRTLGWRLITVRPPPAELVGSCDHRPCSRSKSVGAGVTLQSCRK